MKSSVADYQYPTFYADQLASLYNATKNHQQRNSLPVNNSSYISTPQGLMQSPGQQTQQQQHPQNGQYSMHPYLAIDPILLNPGVSLAAASTLMDWPGMAGQNCCSYIQPAHQQHNQDLIMAKDPIIQSLMGNPTPNGSLVKEEGVSLPPGQKIDTSQHYHIFVGDLSPEIDAYKLRDAFSNFGFVTECKIIKDMHTHKPKGYGFVAYANYEEAELAKIKMNGQTLGSRSIRTNWAVRKPPSQNARDQKPLNYDEVSSASSLTNSTIYIGAVPKALEEDTLKEFFKGFGKIQEIRIFKEKGYAFVRFESHELATKSIITMHGGELCGSPVKVSWGKETGEEKDIIQQLPNPGQSLSTSSTSLNSFLRPEMVFSRQVANTTQSPAVNTAALLGYYQVQPNQASLQQNPLNLLTQANASLLLNQGHLQAKNVSSASNAFLNII